MIGTLTASSKLNSSHFFYKGIYTEIISVIFLRQTKCLITRLGFYPVQYRWYNFLFKMDTYPSRLRGTIPYGIRSRG